MADTEETLCAEITRLKQQLHEKILKLRVLRLYKYINLDTDYIANGLKHVEFIDIRVKPDYWCVKYKHTTTNFSENNYIFNSDSEVEEPPKYKVTEICFGYEDNKYFIHGNKDRFKLFISAANQIRIMLLNYEVEMDIQDHLEFWHSAMFNKDMPEFIALRMFDVMNRSTWTSEDVIQYFIQLQIE